jgi:predicted transcriptional regulator
MTAWFVRVAKPPATGRVFGPLEWRVLEALWRQSAPASVRDLQPGFPDTAYTTLMTTLDRLHRKGVLDRTKQGRAFRYWPRETRAELQSSAVERALRVAIEGDGGSLRPLMSFFVDAVGEHDHQLLDELEHLVRARRADREIKSS